MKNDSSIPLVYVLLPVKTQSNDRTTHMLYVFYFCFYMYVCGEPFGARSKMSGEEFIFMRAQNFVVFDIIIVVFVS